MGNPVAKPMVAARAAGPREDLPAVVTEGVSPGDPGNSPSEEASGP